MKTDAAANFVSVYKFPVKVIGVSGYARSGKDTTADYLVKTHGFEKISFAAPLKEAVYRLNPIVEASNWHFVDVKRAVDTYGWENAKDIFPEVRRLLQVFGTEVGRDMFGDSFWIDQAIKKIKNKPVVFSDVRFRNEADMITSCGGVVWNVKRNGVESLNDHPSENNLKDYIFDRVIENNDSLYDLYHEIQRAYFIIPEPIARFNAVDLKTNITSTIDQSSYTVYNKHLVQGELF